MGLCFEFDALAGSSLIKRIKELNVLLFPTMELTLGSGPQQPSQNLPLRRLISTGGLPVARRVAASGSTRLGGSAAVVRPEVGDPSVLRCR